MSASCKAQVYRDMIDELVSMCRRGQGQIGADRARKGVWNDNATTDSLQDQCEANLLLARLTQDEREILSRLLADEVVTGVFETLKVLEKYQVPPFEDGYEGSPFHDFIGRLGGDWEWPEDAG